MVTGLEGLPLNPDGVSHSFADPLASLDLPKLRFHDLRHTHATILIAEGIHPKVFQERLGHTNISVTLDTYSHVVPGLQEKAVLAIEEALSELETTLS